MGQTSNGQGTISKVGDTITYTASGGTGANFAGLYGTFAGLTVVFSAAPDGVQFSLASAQSLSGGGTHSQWQPPSNTPNMWDLSSLPTGSSIKLTCTAITSGSASVFIGNKPSGIGGTQTVTYSASMTPDPNQGTIFLLTHTDTNAATVNAPTSGISGQEITFEVSNASGGSMGTITWNAIYKLAGAFSNPANGKKRTITFRYDGTNWIEVSRAAADI